MKKIKLTYQDDYISDDLLKKYFKGELTESENQKFLDLADKNDFNRDAVEGYNSVPSATGLLNEVKKSGSKFFSGSNNILFYLVPSIIILSITILFLFKTTNTEKNISQNNDDIKKTESFGLAVNNHSETVKISDQKNKIPEKPEVIEIKSVHFSPVKEKNMEEFMIIASKGPSYLLPDDNSTHKYYDIDNKMYSNPGNVITYYQDLKVVKYSDDRKNQSDRSRFDLGSLEPEYRNQQEKASNPDHLADKKIQYSDFLKFSLKKFVNKNYSESINDFHIILNQFPDDINALFYTGLCYYSLNLPDKAIEFFNKVSNHPIKTFDQESEWYLALSYLKKQNISEAKKILNSIAEKEGFYALKAESELEKLE